MKQGASSHVDDLGFGQTEGARHFESHFRHALRVAFRFAVAQIQRSDPAFNRTVISLLQILMSDLKGFLGSFSFCDITGCGLNFDHGICLFIENGAGRRFQPYILPILLSGSIRDDVCRIFFGLYLRHCHNFRRVFWVDEFQRSLAD